MTQLTEQDVWDRIFQHDDEVFKIREKLICIETFILRNSVEEDLVGVMASLNGDFGRAFICSEAQRTIYEEDGIPVLIYSEIIEELDATSKLIGSIGGFLDTVINRLKKGKDC